MEPQPFSGWLGRFSAWLEAFIMTRLVARDNPGPVFRLLFKIPILYYRLGLGAFFLYPPILLLTTTGRRSGRAHVTPLEFTHAESDGTYTVSAGWGGKTDWYRNARANPAVTVQVGRKTFQARAVPCPDEDIGRQMYTISRNMPVMDRVWQRWSDQPMDGSLASYVHAARFFPSMRLVPTNPAEMGAPATGPKPAGQA